MYTILLIGCLEMGKKWRGREMEGWQGEGGGSGGGGGERAEMGEVGSDRLRRGRRRRKGECGWREKTGGRGRGREGDPWQCWYS